jgi:DNA invertase Pin-like site-specific DNA recombinase
MPVAVYARISKDDDDRALGVGRQMADCQAIAAVRRWLVAEPYSDNDFSAFKTQVRRPAFERMLQDLQAGALDGVVVYDLDRLARQPADLERLITIFDSRPGLRFATVQGDVDLMSSDGRTMARVLIAFANKSSMDTSRRNVRKHLELAQAGEPVGGTRPFGWQQDKRTLEPAEAAALQRAAADVIHGAALHTVTAQWNAQGLMTPRGNPWEKTILKRVLLSPRLAGWRVHRGVVAVSPEGALVRGAWTPILEDTTWEALCAVLRDPKRTGDPRNHAGARRYLLSGTVTCGLCSTPMYGAWAKKYDRHNYVCPLPTSSRSGCGKVAITGPPVDALISTLVLNRLDEESIEPPQRRWDGEGELDELHSRRAQIMAAFAHGSLRAEAAFPAAESLSTQIDQLMGERAEHHRAEFRSTVAPSDVAASWQHWTLEKRREQIRDLLSAVLVRPATRKGASFTPDRLSAVWAQR